MTLLLDPHIQWDCHSCSDCCRGWKVPASRDVRDKLMAHDWGAKHQHLADGAGFLRPADPHQPVYFAQREGRCAFLDADNLCIQHKELGYASKSLACSSFPFSFIDTPDGTVTALSFACPSVIRNDGRSLEAHLADLAVQAERGKPARPSIEKSLPLTDAVHISWSEYRAREERWSALVAETHQPLRQRLTQGLSIMLDRSFAPSEQKESALSRLLLAALIAPVETPTSGMAQRLTAILRLYQGKGSFDSATLKASIPLESRPTARLFPEASAMLTRYISHWLFRKSLIHPFPTVQWGCRFLLTAVILIFWYASSSAAVERKKEPTAEDFERAIKIVERHYVVHQTFLANVVRSPRARKFLSGILSERKLLSLLPG